MNKSFNFAIIAFSIWGLLPIYLKQLTSFNPYELTAYRVIFSLITVFIYLLIKDFSFLKRIRNYLVSPMLYLSSFLIGINWLLFVYCVAENKILEASFGYFSGPILSIFLGVLFLKEKLTPLKKVAFILVVASVLIQGFILREIPIVSVILASSFALYGLVKKFTIINTLESLFLESLILCPPSVYYILQLENFGYLPNANYLEAFFISLAGICTIAPLYFFSKAAKELELNILGFIQYLAPLLQFCVGIFIYEELISSPKKISFLIIWISCVMVIYEQKKVKNER